MPLPMADDSANAGPSHSPNEMSSSDLDVNMLFTANDAVAANAGDALDGDSSVDEEADNMIRRKLR